MPASGIVITFLKQCKGFDRVLEKVKVISAGHGSCLSELKLEKEHTNSMGNLHGGFSATLVDVISTMALMTHERVECPHVSVHISMDYLKGAKIGDSILIDAKTLKAGKNLAFMEVEIRDKVTDSLLVKGSHTKYLLTS